MTTISIGYTTNWERTFTEQDVVLFAEISGDKAAHHTEKDAEGRLMVHGLLTATIPTKIGSIIDFIAREITFEFVRPVFTGDTVSCVLTINEVEPSPNYTKIAATFVCTNQHGKKVLKGSSRGVVR
ncbi:MaoC/PaaZ C-terminal domain-containing protein [Tumebacillus permanentifrigoris]|uniref:Acyl dehydratase n=1 Tax=Tumebacillus permanentifrigoris TaxID=378543 RepID=A0A316DC98_9BACL|nr:MaoC/PaaZ C-terminal domain-containing protein [Tumebacillus permanentifrigoris]PWK14969.1 acyl dehydratase [Tumebacillus permanentifrigoris]